MPISRLNFEIQKDKTYELTQLVFKAPLTYFYQVLEEIYQEARPLTTPEGFEHIGIYLGSNKVYRNLDPGVTHRLGFLPYSSLNSQKSTELLQFYVKMKKDIRFIQQWLSIAYSCGMNSIPPIIANELTFNQAYSYKIPEGKAALWEKVEKILAYYMGMRLLV